MPDWNLNHLLAEYGLPKARDVNNKRKFAMAVFLYCSDH